MNFGELKIALKRYGFNDKDPLAVWLNAALNTIRTRDSWTFLEGETTLTLTADPNEIVSLPGDFQRVIKLRDVSESPGMDLEYVDIRTLYRDYDNPGATGLPTRFSILGDGDVLRVWPFPDLTRNYRLLYERNIAELANDADVPGIPSAYHYAIVLCAAYIGLMAENEEDRATTAQNQFESRMADMMGYFGSKQSGEPEVVQDVQGYGY